MFIVNLKDVDQDDNENMATVIIALMQLDGRVNRMRSNNTLGINQEMIQFKVYKVGYNFDFKSIYTFS